MQHHFNNSPVSQEFQKSQELSVAAQKWGCDHETFGIK